VTETILRATNIRKSYGHVVAIDGADFELRKGEILGIIGDNGAGKSTLIKTLSGAVIPDDGQIYMEEELVSFKSPLDARRAGIETVYQNLALAPALSIIDNMYLGRELLVPGWRGKFGQQLDKKRMRSAAKKHLSDLGILTVQNIGQSVETLSGGQRQGVAIARSTAFGGKVVIMDEPTAALGVKESGRVLDLIANIRDKGVSVVLISHNMPHLFEVSDRVHIHRLGKRVALENSSDISMNDAVAIMTGAMQIPQSL
jgi:fructose transport system ATP-binding protein